MMRSQLRGAFAHFLDSADAAVGNDSSEDVVMDGVTLALKSLIRSSDWLPIEYQRVNPEKYESYALYVDPAARFSVVSFVWGPAHSTPVHDHTVWGLVGVLSGQERCEEYAHDAHRMLIPQHAHNLFQGEIDRVSPTIGDVHKVSNAYNDRASISIHVYGGDIGTISRHWYDDKGVAHDFVSGYSNPTPWIHA